MLEVSRRHGGATLFRLGRTGASELSPEGAPSNVGLTQVFMRGGLLNQAHDLHLNAVAFCGSCTHTVNMSPLQPTGLDVTGGLPGPMCRPMCGEGQQCRQTTASISPVSPSALWG